MTGHGVMPARWPTVRQRLRGDDDGQIALLILVYALIAAALVAVVADTSRAFLYRRALAAAADGAATSGANALDSEEYYARAGAGDQLPLGPSDVAAAVQTYAGDAGLAGRFEGFAVATASTDGLSVSVTLSARAPMVFDVMRLAPGGARVEVTASARAPYVP